MCNFIAVFLHDLIKHVPAGILELDLRSGSWTAVVVAFLNERSCKRVLDLHSSLESGCYRHPVYMDMRSALKHLLLSADLLCMEFVIVPVDPDDADIPVGVVYFPYGFHDHFLCLLRRYLLGGRGILIVVVCIVSNSKY